MGKDPKSLSPLKPPSLLFPSEFITAPHSLGPCSFSSFLSSSQSPDSESCLWALCTPTESAPAAEVPGGRDTGHCWSPQVASSLISLQRQSAVLSPGCTLGLWWGLWKNRRAWATPGQLELLLGWQGCGGGEGHSVPGASIGRYECTGGWCKVGTRGGPITSPRIWRDAHLGRDSRRLHPHPSPGCPVKREVEGERESRRHVSARSLHGTHSQKAWQTRCPRRALKERDLCSTL